MILYPPVRFDANEWFIIVVSVVTWAAIFLLPKRFSFLTALVMWLLTTYLSQTVDMIIGKPPLLLYFNNDLVEYEYFDLLLNVIAFPPFGYFFVYFVDKWAPKGLRLYGYVLLWATVTTLLEWISIRFFHVFTFTGWTSLYSFFAYIPVYYLYIVVFRFVQHYQLEASLRPRSTKS